MKYLIFEDFQGRALPIIFPERIDHLEMREQMPYATVLAAGFVDLEGLDLPAPGQGGRGFRCHGKSLELGLGARDEDAAVIAKAFAGEGA